MIDLNTARTRLTEASDLLWELDQRRAALQAELNEVAAQERDAQAGVTALTGEVARLEREPAARAQLERLTVTLRARLAEMPLNSPTAQRVRERLPTLGDESFPAADRLEMVRDALRDLQNHHLLDRRIWDAKTPHLPGRELHC